MTRYQQVQRDLRDSPAAWLVTGAAGFIGSNLVQTLLDLGQRVVGLDNFATGHRHNLEDVRGCVHETAWDAFTFIEGDIRNLDTCHQACAGVDYVLHQAALGSVPRSIHDPIATTEANVLGFVNMLVAARDAGVKRFIYAASSSTYGDSAELPKVENRIGRPLSPYAVTKYVNELYAEVFGRCYGLETVGLRYFNVFVRRQDPDGAYAAVIPKWVGNLLSGASCTIHGDGETSRDFTYVDNAVQANVLAATARSDDVDREVFNVATGQRTTLNDLFRCISGILARSRPDLEFAQPLYGAFRPGDVRHSLADITKITTRTGFEPTHSLVDGLEAALPWYCETYERRVTAP